MSSACSSASSTSKARRSAAQAGAILRSAKAVPASVSATDLDFLLPSQKDISTRPLASSERSAELMVCFDATQASTRLRTVAVPPLA